MFNIGDGLVLYLVGSSQGVRGKVGDGVSGKWLGGGERGHHH